MMQQQISTHKILYSITLISILIIGYPTSAVASEVDDEREFDYIKGSEKGPVHWGEIKKEWATCNNGSLQSPIDLSYKRVKVITDSKGLKTNYWASNATLENRGHDISVQWLGEKPGYMEINGTKYFLQQCHWHSPSEHTVNGKRYAMELHMVHESTDPNVTNNTAVIGVLYEIGLPDRFLSKLIPEIRTLNDQITEKNIGMVDPTEIGITVKEYYRYLGSLTTPPCTEGVIWTINKRVRTVSKDQVETLREAVHDYAEENARPLQPLNEREIQLHKPNPTGKFN